jgi:uncharacterized protein (DUF1499 family)
MGEKEERKTGLVNGKFHPCPQKKVCVSTQSPPTDDDHYIEPIKMRTSIKEAKDKMKDIISSIKRTKLLEENENYLHYVFKTFLFRFKDDVEFLFDKDEDLIHFRSQSRIGGFDWGKNRKRMEEIRDLYSQK